MLIIYEYEGFCVYKPLPHPYLSTHPPIKHLPRALITLLSYLRRRYLEELSDQHFPLGGTQAERYRK